MQRRPRILVTGATGFIGRQLVDRLLEGEPAHVRILTRQANHIPDHWRGNVDIWMGDLTDPPTLSGVADGVDAVYHLAAEARLGSLCDSVNRGGTESLLTVCHSSGVQRFLYVSSISVMDTSGTAARLDETSGVHPRGAYATSKHAGERVAFRFHSDYGMRVSAVRPAIVFGEGRSPGSDRFLRLVQLVNSGHFALLGRDYVSTFVYVGDVVAACLMVDKHPQTGGQVYIVSEPVSLTTFVNDMACALGARRPPALPGAVGVAVSTLLRWSGRFGSLRNRTAYSSGTLSSLGFRLPYGYREGLQRTIAWYHQEGMLPPPRHGSQR